MTIKTNSMKAILQTFLGMILATFFIMIISDFISGNWSGLSHYMSLLIPISLMTMGVVFSFIPSYVTITEREISIQYRLRKKKTIPLSTIKAFGEGSNVYALYLKNKISPVQFSTAGFPKNEWKQFEALLSQLSDAAKADGAIGPFPFLKKKSK